MILPQKLKDEFKERVDLEKKIIADIFEKEVIVKSEYVDNNENVMRLSDVVRYIRENYENDNN